MSGEVVRRARAALLLLALAAAGCGAVIPALPSKGGPAWVEFTSPHFTLWTDAPVTQGRALIHKLEQRLQLIMRAMNHTRQTARIFAIALDGGREVRAFVPDRFAAIAWDDDNPSRQPGIVLNADDADHAADVVLSHELAHAVSYSIIKHQPAWLAEGLASYFEMAELDPKRGSAEFGIPRLSLLSVIQRVPLVAAKELFACQGLGCRTVPFYGTSWALLSFLINTRHAQLSTYLQRLNELPRSEHLRAWREAFPDLTFEQIDLQLTYWLNRGAFAVPRIKVSLAPFATRQRELGDADVLAARSLLYHLFGRVEVSRDHAQAALALDRTHLLATLISRPTEPADARALTVAHPGDWRAFALLADLLPEGKERRDSRAQMCALLVRDGDTCPDPQPAVVGR